MTTVINYSLAFWSHLPAADATYLQQPVELRRGPPSSFLSAHYLGQNFSNCIPWRGYENHLRRRYMSIEWMGLYIPNSTSVMAVPLYLLHIRLHLENCSILERERETPYFGRSFGLPNLWAPIFLEPLRFHHSCPPGAEVGNTSPADTPNS